MMLKGMGFGVLIVIALLAMKYSWGLSLDIQGILMFIFGLTPIFIAMMVIGFIGERISGKEDKR